MREHDWSVGLDSGGKNCCEVCPGEDLIKDDTNGPVVGYTFANAGRRTWIGRSRQLYTEKNTINNEICTYHQIEALLSGYGKSHHTKKLITSHI